MNADNTAFMEPRKPGHNSDHSSDHNPDHNPGGAQAPDMAATVLVTQSMSAALSAECPFAVLCGPHVMEYDQAALEELARSAALEGLDLICFDLGNADGAGGLCGFEADEADKEGSLRRFDPELSVVFNSELPVVPVLTRISFARRYHGVFGGATLFSTMQANHDIVPDTSNMLVSTKLLRSLDPSEGLDLADTATRITLAFRLAQASSAARCVAQRLGRAHVPNSFGMLGASQDVEAVQAAEALTRLVVGFRLMMGEMLADGTLTDPHFRNAVMGCWAEIIDDATHALSDHSLLDEAFVQLVGEGAAGEGVSESSGEGISRVPGASGEGALGDAVSEAAGVPGASGEGVLHEVAGDAVAGLSGEGVPGAFGEGVLSEGLSESSGEGISGVSGASGEGILSEGASEVAGVSREGALAFAGDAVAGVSGEGLSGSSGGGISEVPGVSEIVREENLEALWLVDLLSHMVAESRFDKDLKRQEWRAWAAETRVGEFERSTSYRVGRIVTAVPRKLKDSRNRRAQSTSGSIPEFGTLRGDDGRKIRLIAALTSFPPRIDTVSVAIRSMMSQTMPFDSIELNLARSQFPRLEDDLPADLLELRDHGLVIGWCDRDTGPYKRYTRTMRENPDAAVVMLDDDLLCEPDMLETLYRAYLEHPTSVIGVRTHRVVFGPDGAPLSYRHWSHEESSYVGVERMDLYATPGAGTLFPPHCLPDEAFDENLFMELAPNGDDMWLKFMELIAGTPVVLARPYGGLRLIDGTQEATSLWSTNRLTSGNDVTMARLFERFDLYHGPDDTLHSRLRRDIN